MLKIKKNAKINIGLLLMIMILAGLMVGCASTPKTIPSLERARSAYAEASANPDIAANAQVSLYDAKVALDRAEAAKETKDIEHLAYLAERQVQTAVAVAERKMAEAEVERFNQERSRILLNQRSLEAEQAKLSKQEAEARALEAEQARMDAEEKARQLELTKQKAAELQAEIAELQAKQTNRGIVLTLGDVLFDFNKADLQPGALRTIDKLSEFLQKHPERTVAIEGHTDSKGSHEYNLDLSQRRADSVRNALVEKGIDPARIQTLGMAEAYPVASNDTDAGRQRNRRVEIIISKGEEAVQ